MIPRHSPPIVALILAMALPIFGQAPPGEPAIAIDHELEGDEEFSGPGGMDFIVNLPIHVLELGVFDSNSDGLDRPITVELWSRDDEGTPDDFEDDTGIEILASFELDGDDGTLDGGVRFMTLAEPIVLDPGTYTIVGWGYGPDEPAYNVRGDDAADHGLHITDSDTITFVGTSRFGDEANSGDFPDTVDEGPATRYGAGNFRFIDPRDIAGSIPFQIIEITVANGDPGIVPPGNSTTVSLKWPSSPAQSFLIEQSVDLREWLEIADGYPSGGDTTSYQTELPPPTPEALYFRVHPE